MTLLKKRIASTSPSGSPSPTAAYGNKKARVASSSDLIYAQLMQQARLHPHNHHQSPSSSTSMIDYNSLAAALIPRRPPRLSRATPRTMTSRSPPRRFHHIQATATAIAEPSSRISSSNHVMSGGVLPSIVTPTGGIMSPQEQAAIINSGYSSSPTAGVMPSPPFEKSGQVRSSRSSSSSSSSSSSNSAPATTQNPLDLLSTAVIASTTTTSAADNNNVVVSSRQQTRTQLPRLLDTRTSLQQRPPSPPRSPIPSTAHVKDDNATTTNSSSSCYMGQRSPITGHRHGRGIMKYPNGCRYVGSFHNNRRHGYGKVWYPAGLGIYTGHWNNNQRHGLGSMEFANGDVYNGHWEHDVPHGKGILHMKSSGDVFTGSFCKKCKEGKGVYTYSNGNVYEGYWKEDVRHGEGRMIYKNGVVECRLYYRGVIVGK